MDVTVDSTIDSGQSNYSLRSLSNISLVSVGSSSSIVRNHVSETKSDAPDENYPKRQKLNLWTCKKCLDAGKKIGQFCPN